MADRGARPPGSGLVRGGAFGLAGLLVAVLLGPFLVRNDPDATLDPAVAGLLPPGSRVAVVTLGDGSVLAAERIEPTVAGVRLIRRGETREVEGDARVEHRWFWLGTDRFGRDLLARILDGGRRSLAIGLAALAAAVAAGLVVGSVAGSAGGRSGRWLDRILMRGVDGMLAFPPLLLALALAAFLGPSTATTTLVLAATGWMGASRLVRGEIRALREREFILAARAIGASPARIYFRHLLPNAWTPVLIDAMLRIGDLLLAEAALSFLGFGVQPPHASWGNLLADARGDLGSAWWTTVFPGLAIFATVWFANLVGDGLRDRFDPRAAA
jgi:peptide/nickel transport system permease protein